MKKIFAFILAICILSSMVVSASAASLKAVPTDIKVILHGKEIPSCAVNNAMYIAADDFIHYGYAVTYIDSVRTLFVNKVGEPDEIMPEPCKVEMTQATDIQVILNGEPVDRINARFAANGKMYVSANEISRYRDSFNNSDPGDEGYPHQLTSLWDGEKRILSIDDAPFKPKEEQIAYFLSYSGNRENYSTFLAFTENYYRGDNFDIVSLRVGGLPHGASTRWYYFNDDGRSLDMSEILNTFRIYDGWGNSTVKNPRIEGRRFYFEGQRTMSLIDSTQGIYYGTYYLDLDTSVVNVVSEERTN